MNIEIHKLLAYIKENFIVGQMDIWISDCAEIGLKPIQIQKCLEKIQKLGVIHDLRRSNGSSVDRLLKTFVSPPTGVHTIPVFLFQVNSQQLTLKFSEYDKQIMHDVRFIKENGLLYIDNKQEGEVTPSTDHHTFLSILYNNPNQPVSHTNLFKQIKGTKQTSVTAQHFSNRLMNEIKTKFIPSISRIVSPSKTLNGDNAYMMSRAL